MKLFFSILFISIGHLSYSQGYLNLSKNDIIAIKGNSYEVSKNGNSISYITEIKSTDGYPTLPNIEYFSFNDRNNVEGYVHVVNDAPESYALQLISENNKKYEKVVPDESILLKWVDRKNLIIIRIGWITKNSNGLYSVHYEVDKVDTIK